MYVHLDYYNYVHSIRHEVNELLRSLCFAPGKVRVVDLSLFRRMRLLYEIYKADTRVDLSEYHTQ